MIEVVYEAEKRSFNTIPLNSLLQEVDTRFRQAVLGALRQEGFELDDPVPCLQHSIEVLNAIHWLATLGFGSTWESFRQALLTAGQLGILVDVSVRKSNVLRTKPMAFSEWSIDDDPQHLETA
jgi:hypothetical protein